MKKSFWEQLGSGHKFLLILTVGLILGFVTLYAVAQSTRPDTDPVTGCDRRKPIPRVVTIAIDRTDPMSAAQQKSIKDHVSNIVSDAPANSLVAVFGVQGDLTGIVAPDFCRCKPEDSRTTNPLTGSPELVKRQFDRDFDQPLMQALDAALVNHTSPESPLIEGLFKIARSPQLKPFIEVANGAPSESRQSADMRLIVFSDMLQNSKALTLLDGDMSRERLRTPSVNDFQADFRSFGHIEFNELERPEYRRLQNARLEDFWNEYALNISDQNLKASGGFRYNRIGAGDLPTRVK